MAKPVYCSECGMRLPITLKAIKDYGRIISLVDPHECAEEPMPIDLGPKEVPSSYEGKRKFVQNLNNLTVIGTVGTADLHDRRAPDHIKSTAPVSVLDQIKQMQNTVPEGDVNSDPEGS